MAYNNVDLAYILPDRSLTDAQKLQSIQNEKQLEESRQQRLYERHQREQQAQQYKNLATIDKAADFDQYKTGEQRIDEYAQKEIQGIYNEALANHVSDNPAILQAWLQSRLQPIAKWHTTTQAGYKQALDAADKFTKVYGESADPAAVKLKAIDLLRNTVFDANGNRANTDNIQLPDFNAELNKPETLGQLAGSTEAIDKFYHGLDKIQVHDSDFTSNKGFSNRTKWSGYTTPISDITPDAQGNPTADVKHEVVPGVKDENGQPMKIIDDDVFKTIMGNPSLKMAYMKKWQDQKPEIEQKFMAQTGKPMDSSTEQVAFKHMIYKDAYDKIPHYISKDEATVVPKPPHITINVGQQQAEQTGNWANSVVKAAANNDNAKVNSLIDEMYSGNGERKLMGTYTKDENGQQMLYIRTQKRNPADQHKSSLDEQIVAIPANSPNAAALLLGQYQTIMGSNTKAEALPFAGNPVVPENKPHQSGSKKKTIQWAN